MFHTNRFDYADSLVFMLAVLFTIPAARLMGGGLMTMVMGS